jgi:hypothetical protein
MDGRRRFCDDGHQGLPQIVHAAPIDYDRLEAEAKAAAGEP